jgi:DNA-binding MarR family transcriptional regulator
MSNVTSREVRRTSEQLAPLVARLNNQLRRSSGDLTGLGPTIAQTRALAAIRDGVTRITELAAHEQVTQPAMTALVDRTEKAGWVRRAEEPGDRRAVRLELTDEGRAVLAEVVDRRARALAEHIARLSSPEQAAIAAAIPALQRLHDLHQDAPPERNR